MISAHIPDHTLPDVLLPICDVLVLNALSRAGVWIVRHERCRAKQWRGRPMHEAHERWQASSEVVTKALRHAWDVLPTVLERWGDDTIVNEEDLMNELDAYVHDLVVTGHPHTLDDLRYRLSCIL